MKFNWISPIFFWIFPATVITLICGLIYVSVQQSYREGANNPQIELSEDAANALSSGSLPSLVVGDKNVDISKSLAPFVIVYDVAGRVLESEGHLNGQAPVPPSGTFDFVKSHGEDRITWEPQKGVRIAAVINYYNSSINGAGYVLAGRSLQEVEKRVEVLTLESFIVWISALLAAYVGIFLVYNFLLRQR